MPPKVQFAESICYLSASTWVTLLTVTNIAVLLFTIFIYAFLLHPHNPGPIAARDIARLAVSGECVLLCLLLLYANLKETAEFLRAFILLSSVGSIGATINVFAALKFHDSAFILWPSITLATVNILLPYALYFRILDIDNSKKNSAADGEEQKILDEGEQESELNE